MIQNNKTNRILSDDKNFTIEQIISNLEYFKLPFPHKEMVAAINFKIEITPKLIDLLNYAYQNHSTLSVEYFGHLYALFILAEFKEKSVFPLVIDFLKLPGESLDKLLGDCITEDYHNIIASVYNNNIEAIMQLIEDPYIDTWARNSALCSLLTLVKESVLERNYVINYFRTLFDNINFLTDPLAITHLVRCACELYPIELYDKIKNAFKNGHIDEWDINLDWVDEQIRLGYDDVINREIINSVHYGFIQNAIDSMDWWSCFKSNDNKLMPIIVTNKIGRNDICPCGSGKKYKKCCLFSEE